MARTRAKWTAITCKRSSDDPEEVITVQVMEEHRALPKGTRLRIDRPVCGQVRVLVQGVAIDLEDLEEVDALFIGIFPGGVVYCDCTKEEHGDYKKIAFLPYGSLKLEVYAPKSKLLPAIQVHAAEIQARRGQEFSVSQCGQTVLLGREG